VRGGLFSHQYKAIPGSGGDFTFLSVAQGDYDIAAIFDMNGGIYWVWYSFKDTGNPYTVHVGPLCPTDVGAFQYVAA
jgi:hypothetical protein